MWYVINETYVWSAHRTPAAAARKAEWFARRFPGRTFLTRRLERRWTKGDNPAPRYYLPTIGDSATTLVLDKVLGLGLHTVFEPLKEE